MTIIRRAIKARCTVALVCLFFPVFGNAVPIFFNEIHYENSGADINERIEIAGPAGTVLDDWQIALYNGSTGSQYGRKHLSGVIPNLLDGFGVFSFAFDRPHLQNGPADAFALIDPFGLVLQFLSYEGMVSAIDGLALGLSSDDIGVSEHPDTPADFSLQLAGIGTVYEDFRWSSPSENSFDRINPAQSFHAPTTPVPLTGTHYLLLLGGLILLLSMVFKKRKEVPKIIRETRLNTIPLNRRRKLSHAVKRERLFGSPLKNAADNQ